MSTTPVWATIPDCPRCGARLQSAPDVWKPRGDWMCNGAHDGKRIWWNYELTAILRAGIIELEGKVSELEDRVEELVNELTEANARE